MDEFLEGKAESPKGGEWFGDRFGVVRVEDEGNVLIDYKNVDGCSNL